MTPSAQFLGDSSALSHPLFTFKKSYLNDGHGILEKTLNFVYSGMDFTSNTATKIADYIGALKESDQEKLLEVLERKVLMDEAIRLNKSVKKNSISIEEIIDVVNDVRKKRKKA
jgi:hypothetical protein